MRIVVEIIVLAIVLLVGMATGFIMGYAMGYDNFRVEKESEHLSIDELKDRLEKESKEDEH